MKQRKKKDLKAIFKQLEARPLPDKNHVLSVCEEAFAHQHKVTVASHKRVRPRRALLAMGALMLLLVSCFSIYAVADENREYREAVAFFEQHELSAVGYSRKEIKLIYRDIITGAFTYEKTAEAIENRVGGYEIFQNTPTPEELALLWNYKDEHPNGMDHEGFDANGDVTPEGVSYRYKNQVRYVENTDEAYVVLEKYRDGALEWSKTLHAFSIDELTFTEDYIVCTGTLPSGRVLKLLSAEGEELWQKSIGYCLPRKLIAETDGVSVICSDQYDFHIWFYNWQGRRTANAAGDYSELLERSEESYSFRNAEKLGEHYVIQLCDADSADFFIKVNRKGELLDVFSYHSDSEVYYFTDVVEYHGSLYMSGYAVPKYAGGIYGHELDTLKERVKANGSALSDADTMQALRSHYTAILMKCDASTGQMQAFYTVKGSLGGEFSLNTRSDLVWQVESLADVHCRLGEASFADHEITVTFNGICAVYSYTFDWRGIFLGDTQTGESVGFER